jgi:hypothetical protein
MDAGAPAKGKRVDTKNSVYNIIAECAEADGGVRPCTVGCAKTA